MQNCIKDDMDVNQAVKIMTSGMLDYVNPMKNWRRWSIVHKPKAMIKNLIRVLNFVYHVYKLFIYYGSGIVSFICNSYESNCMYHEQIFI